MKNSQKIIALLLAGCFAATWKTAAGQNEPAQLPVKYITEVKKKADDYYTRITGKTEKTLAKLSRWEQKIKTLLQKISPETASKLFNAGQLTFSQLYGQYKQGITIAENYKGQYDEYRDKLSTGITWVQSAQTNISGKAKKLKQELDTLDAAVRETEAVQRFIKERKQLLLEQVLKHAGSSKYLNKINKEAWYYAETLKNYKELFRDKRKAEEAALKILDKIPAYKKFLSQNSQLASLFRLPGTGEPVDMTSLAGLQTRAQVNNLIQQQITTGGADAMQQFQQNLQAAQSQLGELKNEILKAGGSSNDAIMPEGFKPNNQKTKTFLQRLEYGANIQSQKATNFFPVTSDIGLSLGYRFSDKSVMGIGASYKLGWGRGWNNISITHQGVGLRSFADIKLKKSFWITGGFEMNYRNEFNRLAILRDYNAWQQSGLLGISKVVNIKSKFFKKTKLQLVWDFLSYRQVPRAQPVLFRIEYKLK